MIMMPSIDLKDGRLVRLYQGRFERLTHYSDQPAALATRMHDWGLNCLHIVDLDGARDGWQQNRACIHRIIQASSLSIQLGGGIRDEATMEYWFDAGVTRCVLGSIAVTKPGLVTRWLEQYSADRMVLALDVNIDDSGTPRLATHGWTRATERCLWDLIDQYYESGLSHVLCTDIARDGALGGPNLELYSDFTERYPRLSLQVSGGIRNLADLNAAANTGAAAAITGRALLDGSISQKDVASFLQNE